MIGKFTDFFRHLKNVIAYNQTPKDQRVLTIYSEGKNYWSYLGGLVKNILDNSDVHVCYVTSSDADPGLSLEHDRLTTFVIGEGFVRDWFFANQDTAVMVMTMPDLHQYQVKKSKFPVHYVYVQHSLVSFHMVYRTGAFDFYDTIFCSGPHHKAEMRALEEERNLTPKTLFDHGYARLDAIKEEAARIGGTHQSEDGVTHYLLAPSWGSNGTIETGVGAKIVDLLLGENHKVTLRPHPQTIKFAKDKVDAIVNKHRQNPKFTFEDNVLGQDSLHASDVVICGLLGAALDYAFGLGKPVLFIDVKKKVNNPDYTNIDIVPFEISIRDKIGKVISPQNLQEILTVDTGKLSDSLADEYFYNVGNSDAVGAQEILKILTKQLAV